MVEDLQDPRRTEPAFTLGEREMLDGWLDYHRVTLLLKCEGVSDEQRKRCWVPSSRLSLHGLVRHMAEVERAWYVRVIAGERDTPDYFVVDDIQDSELVPLDDAVWEDDLAVWLDACEQSRVIAAPRSLEDLGTFRDGTPCSLRWVYTHMIEEYARHNGHADFLRELADGAVGS